MGLGLEVVTVKIKIPEVVDRIKAALKNKSVVVGVVGDEAGEAQSDETGKRGATVAEYASYLEFGWIQDTTKRQSAYLSGVLGYDVSKYGFKHAPIKPATQLVMPPRPFLRATARAKKEKWAQVFAKAVKGVGVENIDDALALLGTRARDDVKETIRNNGTEGEKFAERSDLTMQLYAAKEGRTATGRKRKIDKTSAVGRKQALVKTNALHNAITFKIENDE